MQSLQGQYFDFLFRTCWTFTRFFFGLAIIDGGGCGGEHKEAGEDETESQMYSCELMEAGEVIELPGVEQARTMICGTGVTVGGK